MRANAARVSSRANGRSIIRNTQPCSAVMARLWGNAISHAKQTWPKRMSAGYLRAARGMVECRQNQEAASWESSLSRSVRSGKP